MYKEIQNVPVVICDFRDGDKIPKNVCKYIYISQNVQVSFI